MTTDPLADIPSTTEDLGCYSGLYSSRARVLRPVCQLEPACLDDLRRIFAFAREGGRRITFRAGGHSFDGQALGDDIVVSLRELDTIEVLDGDRVRVGPGARWGDILAALKPLGLMPAVTVTTENATAGGTLSGDCLSRFSPAYGKEGAWIKSFDLLMLDGRLLNCVRPPTGAPPSQWTLEQRAFHGTIGGLGYLGAVVAITYGVLSVGQTHGRIGVSTSVRKFRTLEDLAADLVPATQGMVEQCSDPNDDDKLDSIWSAVHFDRAGVPSALVLTSTFTTAPQRKRLWMHRPKLAVRILFEWLLRVRFLTDLLWRLSFRFGFAENKEYVDDLEGYTFFMDGNARAKRLGQRLGFKMRTAQQTFVIPSDPGAARGWDQARDDLVEWLEYANGVFRQLEVSPTLSDVLFLPREPPFFLSASAEQAGFAVSYAFETSSPARLGRIEQAFVELSDALCEKFGGRVYLVKNVFVSETTLANMYGQHAKDFFRLKRELDPSCVLRNQFLERTFGDLLRREYT